MVVQVTCGAIDKGCSKGEEIASGLRLQEAWMGLGNWDLDEEEVWRVGWKFLVGICVWNTYLVE